MIRVLTAFTEELDDLDGALSEILEQLDWPHNSLKNAVGIVHCYSEFLEAGIVSALCEKLPFDVVGCTTVSASVPGLVSQMALTLTVLTSDEVCFAAGVSEPVADDPAVPARALYDGLAAGLAEKPALLIPFIPFMVNVGGDEFINAIDLASGGIPAFGTLAISGDPDFAQVYTTYNGAYYPASIVMLALAGPVNPDFFSVSVSDENILKAKAVVTAAERNLLRMINGLPAVQYFESIGLVSGNELAGLQTMPLVVYLEDGSKLIRACLSGTDDGSAVLCGAVPLNATIALATMGLEDVLHSTEGKMREIAPAAAGRGVLIYSCAGRNWALGMKWAAEHDVVRRCLDHTPYSFCYSGGEIFPDRLANGETANHLQNDSVIICVL
ncbi:MAG: FIST C-terminal domain-containing protein [Candidatus Adiutrix sp.]|jgi:hypothetical protein|nr:FIST C-terminal domain-containing protein [Candidatus Adiutrix sp.]